MRTRLRVLVAVCWLVPAASASAATPCEGLGTLTIPMGSVSASLPVARGAFVPPGPAPAGTAQALYARLPEFCRTALTLMPSSDSDIKVEVWLPASGWNGKFQAVGNGGFAGTLPYAAMARAVLRGSHSGRAIPRARS